MILCSFLSSTPTFLYGSNNKHCHVHKWIQLNIQTLHILKESCVRRLAFMFRKFVCEPKYWDYAVFLCLSDCKSESLVIWAICKQCWHCQCGVYDAVVWQWLWCWLGPPVYPFLVASLVTQFWGSRTSILFIWNCFSWLIPQEDWAFWEVNVPKSVEFLFCPFLLPFGSNFDMLKKTFQ